MVVVAAKVVVLAALVLAVVVIAVVVSVATFAAAISVAEDVMSNGVTLALVTETSSPVVFSGRDDDDDEIRFQLWMSSSDWSKATAVGDMPDTVLEVAVSAAAYVLLLRASAGLTEALMLVELATVGRVEDRVVTILLFPVFVAFMGLENVVAEVLENGVAVGLRTLSSLLLTGNSGKSIFL